MKPTQQIFIITNEKTGAVVLRLDRKTRRGTYHLATNVPQANYLTEIRLSGFTALPSGLKRNGVGFTKGGYLLPKLLSSKLPRFELSIDAERPTEIRRDGRTYSVRVNHGDLRNLLQELRAIDSNAFETQNKAVESFLAERFPRQFKSEQVGMLRYKGGELARILDKQGLVEQLTAADVDHLAQFVPEFLRKFRDRFATPAKLVALSASKKAAEVVYLDKIVQEFEKKLKAAAQNEHAWQEFIRKYILIFNSNYASSLEKLSIALRGKYPDFVLIDAYNYLDIYEIKKPSTPLLKKDESRGNYYWDAEIAKAISQVENYISLADKNSDALRVEIKKYKGLDIRVLKPRGFIIAGRRSQLVDEVMEDNFRLLNSALKNVEVILYDDLLGNLKNFLKRLKKS